MKSQQVSENWITISELVQLLESSSIPAFTRRFKQFDSLTSDLDDWHSLLDSADDPFTLRCLTTLFHRLQDRTTEYKAYSGILPLTYKLASGKTKRFECKPLIQLQKFTSRGKYLLLLESLPTALLELMAQDGKLDQFNIDLKTLSNPINNLPLDIDDLIGLNHRSFMDFKFNLMIDWITIYQDHAAGERYTEWESSAYETGDILREAFERAGMSIDGYQSEHLNLLPIINDGCYVRLKGTLLESITSMIQSVDSDELTEQVKTGLEFTTLKSLQFLGSYDTSVYIRCDGKTVSLLGNVGAFEKPDNVWGFNLDDTIKKCNAIVESFGLPPFTKGKLVKAPRRETRYYNTPYFSTPKKDTVMVDDYEPIHGAKVTTLHITSNLSFQTPENANNFLAYAAGLGLFRHKPQPLYLNGNKLAGCGWAYRSKFVTTKIYSKALEIAYGKSKKTQRFKKGDPYLKRLFEYCAKLAILRLELELKSKYLIEHNLKDLYYLLENQDKLETVFKKYFGVLFMNLETAEQGDIVDILKPKELMIYQYWCKNRDLSTVLKTQATFYRYRKALIQKLGIDIRQPCTDPDEQYIIPSPRFENMVIGRAEPMPDYQLSELDKKLSLKLVA